MKPGRRSVLGAAAAGALIFPASGLAAKPGRSPPPEHEAHVQAEIVVDVANGRVVHRLRDQAIIRPASLAKMMTIELVLAALDAGRIAPSAQIVFSEKAAARPNTKVGSPAGTAMALSDALDAMAVHSANDAATAVAETIAGSEEAFAELMTKRAAAFGMSSTVFANASGLPDPGNASSARDLLLLGGTLLAKHPLALRLLGQRQWTWGGKTFTNTNGLLGIYPGLDAGKTGYIRDSGFHLFATAARGGCRLLALVAGGATAAARDSRMAELLDAHLPPIQT